MKTRISLFAILTLFFAGTFVSIGQEKTKEQEEYAKKKAAFAEAQKTEVKEAEMKTIAMTPEDVAKKETIELQQLMNLDNKQTIRVHEILLSVENEMTKIRANVDDEKRTISINNLENTRNEKMKEFLTPDQFKIYQNYLNAE